MLKCENASELHILFGENWQRWNFEVEKIWLHEEKLFFTPVWSLVIMFSMKKSRQLIAEKNVIKTRS